jgi:hypothetical protein
VEHTGDGWQGREYLSSSEMQVPLRKFSSYPKTTGTNLVDELKAEMVKRV